MSNKALIGSVVERRTSTWGNPPKPSAQTNLGFPSAQHRSQSAFARNKEKQRNRGTARLRDVPNIVSAPLQVPGQEANLDNWREQMREENQRRVEAMTEEEREEEKKQLYERFGPEIGSILKRAKERAVPKKETEFKLISASGTHDICSPRGFLSHTNTAHSGSPWNKHKPST